MKLNPTSALLPVSMPEFGALHPCIPLDQAKGYLKMFDELEHSLCEITGYDKISFQSNRYTTAYTLYIKYLNSSKFHNKICPLYTVCYRNYKYFVITLEPLLTDILTSKPLISRDFMKP